MGHRAQLLPAACHKRPQTHGENSGFLDLMILGCRGGLPQVSPGLSSQDTPALAVVPTDPWPMPTSGPLTRQLPLLESSSASSL